MDKCKYIFDAYLLNYIYHTMKNKQKSNNWIPIQVEKIKIQFFFFFVSLLLWSRKEVRNFFGESQIYVSQKQK